MRMLVLKERREMDQNEGTPSLRNDAGVWQRSKGWIHGDKRNRNERTMGSVEDMAKCQWNGIKWPVNTRTQGLHTIHDGTESAGMYCPLSSSNEVTETPNPPLISTSLLSRRRRCEILENTLAYVGMGWGNFQSRLLPPHQVSQHRERLTGKAAVVTSPCRWSDIYRSRPFHCRCGISCKSTSNVYTEMGTNLGSSRHYEPRSHRLCGTTTAYGNMPPSFPPSPPYRGRCSAVHLHEGSPLLQPGRDLSSHSDRRERRGTCNVSPCTSLRPYAWHVLGQHQIFYILRRLPKRLLRRRRTAN